MARKAKWGARGYLFISLLLLSPPPAEAQTPGSAPRPASTEVKRFFGGLKQLVKGSRQTPLYNKLFQVTPRFFLGLKYEGTDLLKPPNKRVHLIDAETLTVVGRHCELFGAARGGKINEIWAPPEVIGSRLGVSYQLTAEGMTSHLSGLLAPARALRPLEQLVREIF